jgi:tetratricopeptide (TPR) repeat protein
MPYDADWHESIIEYRKPVVPAENLNFALCELYRGQLFFEAGDYLHSDSRFANACKVMAKIAADEREGTSVALNEQMRTFKGEPYERAMASVYRAICRYNLGDYSGALAAARSALAYDEETRSDNQADRKDFVIAYTMAALSYARLGEREEALATIAAAKQYAPNNAALKPEILDANFIGVLASGWGPFLMEGAFWNKYYQCGQAPENKVKLLLDGQVASEAIEATDLFAQANCQKFGEADSAAVGRGIAKEALNAVLSALAGRDMGIHEHRDLRCWRTLPRRLHFFAVKATPGLHTLTLQACGDKGQDLVCDRQVWFDVPVREKPDHLYYFRVVPYAQNMHGLTPQPLQEVLTWKESQKQNYATRP